MNAAKKVIIPVAVGLGVLSGFLLFTFGEYLDNHMSNFMAWFVCPAVIPLAIASVVFLLCTSKPSADRKKHGVIFFSIYYAMHWLPMGMWILGLILAGGT